MFISKLFKHWTYQVFSPGTVLREKYEAFKYLLTHDKRAHELIAELEEIYHNNIKVDFKVIEDKHKELSYCVSRMIDELSRMSPLRYLNLRDYFKKFDFYIRFMLAPAEYDFAPPYTILLNEIPSDGNKLVGGKALNLSAIDRELRLPLPQGFVITTNAFFYFIEYNNLRKSIDDRLSKLDISSTPSLDAISREIMELVTNAQIPPDIEEAIINSFRALKELRDKDIGIAMRSSAVGEDTRSSFAGQYRTVLNVREEEGMLTAYKDVIASKYTPEALYYRINYGFLDIETPMAVLAIEMIDAEASGVMYTKGLDDTTKNCINIHSVWGLGELLVGGDVSPDIIIVSKDEKPQIVETQTGGQSKQMVFSQNNSTNIIHVDDKNKNLLSLDEKPALILAGWGIQLERFFKEPQDVEWCMDNNGRLFILQSRPQRIEDGEQKTLNRKFENISNTVLVSGGERASSGIGAGTVFIVKRESDLEKVAKGAVLVARNASPRYVKIMDKLSAVITDIGSTEGHFPSVAREFGVPVLVNTGVATSSLRHGSEVTVYADGKKVYDGIVQAMLESISARKDLISDSPFMRKMKHAMSFISPLKLIDPQAPSFVPEGCRSFHDIIRFVHEKAMQEMFSIGERKTGRLKGAKKLFSRIPMLFYILDVGDGLSKEAANKKEAVIEDILCAPMKAVWKGLNHPGIRWSEFTHFDWLEFDKIVMRGGTISTESSLLASYAIVSNDYLNLNLRFGYHFVILDTICGDRMEDNYISFRFSGGGGDSHGRFLRAALLCEVLERLGFEAESKGDLVDGQLKIGDKALIEERLDMIGRLLGATRLMDMYLKDETMAARFADDFMGGRYHFATVDE